MKTVYDSIREGNFVPTLWMKEAEALFEKNSIVVAWWCRQSGKSTFSVKIIHDYALKTPMNIVLLCPYHKHTVYAKENLLRTFKPEEIKKVTSDLIFLMNGSIITLAANSSKTLYLNNADLIVFDEFDFMAQHNFTSHLDSLRSRNSMTTWEKIKYFLGLYFPTPLQKLVFTSSMKDGENFGTLLTKMKKLPISRINGNRVNFEHSEKMKVILGSASWKKEYDSYEKED
jgi:hypothetical protein